MGGMFMSKIRMNIESAINSTVGSSIVQDLKLDENKISSLRDTLADYGMRLALIAGEINDTNDETLKAELRYTKRDLAIEIEKTLQVELGITELKANGVSVSFSMNPNNREHGMTSEELNIDLLKPTSPAIATHRDGGRK